MKCRVCEVVQYEKNPKTGEDLHFNENVITNVLKKHDKGVKRYAYICHNRDTYTEEDRQKRIDRYKVNGICDESEMTLPEIGELKPAHWHIVLDFGNTPFDTKSIAKWFNVPENQVAVPKGRGAFLDKCEYLTHRRYEDKAHYDFGEIKCNFKLEKELDDREKMRLKYNRDLTSGELMGRQILYEGKTLKECIEEDDLLYMKHMKEFQRYRLEYLMGKEPPKTKINYYISGRGGFGKGLLSKALARTLFPDKERDEDIFFEVGASKVSFEGYDGQEVIIWNDCRAIDLINILDGRGNVFDVFDPVGSKRRQNVKYGSVVLSNKVNIVNSVQSYDDFLNGLAGEYINKYGEHIEAEDKNQSYRRFPFIIPLRIDDFDLYVNKGWAEDNNNFGEYVEYNHIRGNMQKIAKAYADVPEERRIAEKKVLEIPEMEYRKYENKFDKPQLSEEEIEALRKEIMETYGKCESVTESHNCPFK